MKKRLDLLLVEKGFFESREKAKKAIMAGIVVVNDQRIDKAGTLVRVDKEIRIKGEKLKYVGRGGLKLEKAIDYFELDFYKKTVLDVGSSTGGFTDCSLQNGASFVYAVDVGTNQLAFKLRQNPKVKSMENKHIKDLKMIDIDDIRVDIIVCDVSFISLRGLFKYFKEFVKDNGVLITLFKPQFEVGKENLSKGGIAKDKKTHLLFLEQTIEKANECQFYLQDLVGSPIKGAKGNTEYLLYFINNKPSTKVINIEEIIKNN